MRHVLRRIGQADRLEPAQHAQLRGRFAQSVEDHGPHECRRIELPARGAQRPGDCRLQAERVPQLVQEMDVSVAESSQEPGLLGPRGRSSTSRDALQSGNQGVERALAQLVDAPEGGDDALAHLAVLVSMAFDELHVAARA